MLLVNRIPVDVCVVQLDRVSLLKWPVLGPLIVDPADYHC
jgi:hypothetical protein